MSESGQVKKIPGTRKNLKYIETVNGNVLSRECSICREMKSITSFNKRTGGFAGHKTYCKTCASESFKRWREDNIEKEKERRRDYYIENREIEIRNAKIYVEMNRDKVAETKRRWKVNNRELHALSEQRRRTRKSKLPCNFTAKDLESLLRKFDNSCALTGRKDNLQIDHIIPLATGHGGTIYGNMAPLTGVLNSSKNDANIFEWFEANRRRFELSQDKFDRLIDFLAEANDMTVEEYRDYVYWCHKNPQKL